MAEAPKVPAAPEAPEAPKAVKGSGYEAVNDIYTMIDKKRVTIAGGKEIPAAMAKESLDNLIAKELAVKIK